MLISFLFWFCLNDKLNLTQATHKIKDICLYLYRTCWSHLMLNKFSLLYGAEDPSIAGMVLDSSFANLYDLMLELVDVYKIRVPKFTVWCSDNIFDTNFNGFLRCNMKGSIFNYYRLKWQYNIWGGLFRKEQNLISWI